MIFPYVHMVQHKSGLYGIRINPKLSANEYKLIHQVVDDDQRICGDMLVER